MTDDFDTVFRDRFLGSRDAVRLMRRFYLPFVRPLAARNERMPVFDVRCGLGEWLELMQEIGFEAQGVEVDPRMIAICRAHGLRVNQSDALAGLQTLPDDSQAIVSAFGFVEHISFDQLRAVVAEARRVLTPGGLLIMETPNPENIAVATCRFYRDPARRRPIPPELLAFVAEFEGFAPIRVVDLPQGPEAAQGHPPSLYGVLAGAGRDYAVIARKEGTRNAAGSLDPVTHDTPPRSLLKTLARRYDTALSAEIEFAQTLAGQAHAKARQSEIHAYEARLEAEAARVKAREAEAMARTAVSRAEAAHSALAAIHRSRSWRVTAAFRWAGAAARRLTRGVIAWATLAPGSRPQRIGQHLAYSLQSRSSLPPRWRAMLARWVPPSVGVAAGGPVEAREPSPISDRPLKPREAMEEISPEARRIYDELKASLEAGRRRTDDQA
jgi:O-antigen chain-terminating methyltransferase